MRQQEEIIKIPDTSYRGYLRRIYQPVVVHIPELRGIGEEVISNVRKQEYYREPHRSEIRPFMGLLFTVLDEVQARHQQHCRGGIEHCMEERHHFHVEPGFDIGLRYNEQNSHYYRDSNGYDSDDRIQVLILQIHVHLLFVASGKEALEQTGLFLVLGDVQNGDVVHHTGYITGIHAIVITADKAVFINQHEFLGMNEIIGSTIAFECVHEEFVTGQVVDFLLIPGEQPPVTGINTLAVSIMLNHRYRITNGIYREGKYLDEGIVLGVSVLYPLQVFDEGGANGGAAREEVIHDNDLAFHLAKAHLFSELIGESEVFNLVKNGIVGRFSIFHDRVYSFCYKKRRYRHDILAVMVHDQVPC